MEDRVEIGHDVPVLRDYAFVADGFRGALVGPGGEYVWLCFPAWHDPAVFGQLIGSGGAYVVRPRQRYVWGGYYEEGSLIWHSRWVTNGGIVECREALALPADPDRVVVLRQLVGFGGRRRRRHRRGCALRLRSLAPQPVEEGGGRRIVDGIQRCRARPLGRRGGCGGGRDRRRLLLDPVGPRRRGRSVRPRARAGHHGLDRAAARRGIVVGRNFPELEDARSPARSTCRGSATSGSRLPSCTA